jgi:hypothetical protein
MLQILTDNSLKEAWPNDANVPIARIWKKQYHGVLIIIWKVEIVSGKCLLTLLLSTARQ